MPSTPPPPLENADILWQDSGAPYSSRFGDIYFSREGGLDETEYVFLAANRLQERWREAETALQASGGTGVFTIGELGFGTGLNFLCTWRAWQAVSPKHLRLHVISCERFPLQQDVMSQALAQWPALQPLSQALLKAYPDHSAGYHRLHLAMPDGSYPVTLDLYYGDAAETLAAQPERRAGKVDAWFLDGFAPRVNPEMWSPALIAQLARLSRPGSTLSTYSVAGLVQRGLRDAGFAVEKHPGFGSKREMLIGNLPRTEQTTATPSGWLSVSDSEPTARKVIVIGGGMAGCLSARALARKGCRVTLLERSDALASGASGNRQAVLQCRLSNAVNATRQFNLQAYLYAVRELQALAETHPGIAWHPCGVLNLETAFSARRERCDPVDLSRYNTRVARGLEQAEACTEAGLALDGAATHLPLGGWVNPRNLCLACVDDPHILVRTNAEVDALQRLDGGRWQALNARGEILAEADSIVVANSYLADRFAQTAPIPIVPIRGQVSYVEASADSESLKTIVCGQSYIAPAWEGLHSVGASYSRDIADTALSMQEHTQNLAGITPHLPAGSLEESSIVDGRVSVRATTRDRMPIVGEVPDFSAFEQLYTRLNQSTRKNPDTPLPVVEGLYVSIGHGSHGLGNAPLAAEYLASLICGEALPLQQELVEVIHPARFLLRELRRRGHAPRKTV
ncbi:MAG: bifunctional tRNA (5-methylaminomethyl-2-thiouridine)(34)-methyltransferase MnmD/FAD-dependent 5-carboxymethylaminomethyl-2-thiouridine(34) oxidoreductase MnmC [Pseudomonadales bacterium]|nr:bifunctional tRNA (5-methylaminomethyl-2-thiouridine)(34)-methyltransferase MnmD/FAD-dependent 5-carboxymethylaminomethyl-2-thiouridine(34) oxidoreductase MnmC [Pseudomonadales bacterium]